MAYDDYRRRIDANLFQAAKHIQYARDGLPAGAHDGWEEDLFQLGLEVERLRSDLRRNKGLTTRAPVRRPPNVSVADRDSV